jgi:hypothetical protein
MNDDGVLDALAQARAEGAAARDPVGFAVIEALARWAADQRGEVRALLLRRVQQRLATLPAAAGPSPDRRSLGQSFDALTELVQVLGRMTGATSRSTHTVPVAPSPPPLNAVVAFKDTWSRLRVDQRLRQAMAQVPAQAGPLNSSNLVNRMLQAMREVSPEYLDAFMAHVDTLRWLDQASGGGLSTRPHRKA